MTVSGVVKRGTQSRASLLSFMSASMLAVDCSAMVRGASTRMVPSFRLCIEYVYKIGYSLELGVVIGIRTRVSVGLYLRISLK